MRQLSRILVFVVAACLFATIVAITLKKMDAFANRPLPTPPTNVQTPEVTVTRVLPQTYTANVIGYGSAKAHFSITLTAQVAGRVIALADEFENGHRVAEGTVLAHIDDTEYRAAVASAESDLAEARVALLEEERESLQAQAEWSASGLSGKPDSDLVLRKPQLASKRAALKNAQAILDNARQNLEYTKIIAPFDAVITTREIAPGSYLNSGANIAELSSTDRIEITLALSDQEWQNLTGENSQQTYLIGKTVNLTSVEGTHGWQGQILRTLQHVDTETRQRGLIISVEDPLSETIPLFPGTFLQAEITGQERSQLWKLPSSALSQRGEIWYVQEDKTLMNLEVDPVFTDKTFIYIHAPDAFADTEHKIVNHPLNSYLQGMVVTATEVKPDV